MNWWNEEECEGHDLSDELESHLAVGKYGKTFVVPYESVGEAKLNIECYTNLRVGDAPEDGYTASEIEATRKASGVACLFVWPQTSAAKDDETDYLEHYGKRDRAYRRSCF